MNPDHFISFDSPVEGPVEEAREKYQVQKHIALPTLTMTNIENHTTPRQVRRRPAWIADYVSGENIK